MITKTLKVHALRSDTPTTTAVDLVPVEDAPNTPGPGSIRGLTTVYGLSAEDAAQLAVHQVLVLTLAVPE